MVGFHLARLVDASPVGIGPVGAQRAVRRVFGLGHFRLSSVRGLLRGAIEQPHIEEAGITLATQEILVDALVAVDCRVHEEFLKIGVNLSGVISFDVVFLIEVTPVQPLHGLIGRSSKNTVDPVDNRGEVRP